MGNTFKYRMSWFGEDSSQSVEARTNNPLYNKNGAHAIESICFVLSKGQLETRSIKYIFLSLKSESEQSFESISFKSVLILC